MRSVLAALTLFSLGFAAQDSDVIVYSGTAGGVIAAVASARSGAKTLLVHEQYHVGGMVASGLGKTDIGNAAVVKGMANEFFVRVGKKYGKSDPTYYFEPHVAEEVFEEMMAEESSLSIVRNEPVVSSDFDTSTRYIRSITTKSGSTYSAKVFLDASYNGELLPRANVSYTWGREGQTEYNESLAGRLPVPNNDGDHQFYKPVTHTWPNGTLLPFVLPEPSTPYHEGDKRVQAYNFRMCLTDNPSNRNNFTYPPGYDPSKWQLLRNYMKESVDPSKAKITDFIIVSPMPNSKTDINNHGPISTDMIGGSWKYPTANYEEQYAIYDAHKQYTWEFFWFLLTDDSVPPQVRKEFSAYGLSKDEFKDTEGWPFQLYVREGRRMVGDFVFNQNDRMVHKNKTDSIGLGSYNQDTHHAIRFAQSDQYVRNEGDIEVGHQDGPFQMPYRMLLAKKTEAANFLAPVPCSASHIGYGAIRLEPQFMILGQSSGVAAAMAASKAGSSPVDMHALDVSALQQELVKQGQKIDY